MKKKTEISKYLLFSLLPVLFQFIAHAHITTKILTYFHFNADFIAYFSDIFYALGIVTSFLPLGIVYITRLCSRYIFEQQQAFLLVELKRYVLYTFSYITRIDKTELNMNIRIFTPKRRFCDILVGGRKLFKKVPLEFVMKNVNGFTDNNIKAGLTFRVSPDPQGLVGQCYTVRNITCDLDLNNTPIDYNLSDYQRIQTKETSFCACVPLINKKDKLFAIMSFDSEKSIDISYKDMNLLFLEMKKFSRYFSENMGTLFK